MHSVAELREVLKKSLWINVFGDDETWSSCQGWISPATNQVVAIIEEQDNIVNYAPLFRFKLEDLIDFAIDHGYFDDKFPGWAAEGTFLKAEPAPEWEEAVAEASSGC